MSLRPEQIDEILGYRAFNNYTEVQKSALRVQLSQSNLEYLQIAVFFSDDSIGSLIPDLVADSYENDASALALGKLIENANESINFDYGYAPTAIIGNLIGRLGPYDEKIAVEATDLIKNYAVICNARIISPSKRHERVFAEIANDLIELRNLSEPLSTEHQGYATLTQHGAFGPQERQSLGRFAREQVTVLRNILANQSVEPAHLSEPLFEAVDEREEYLTVMRSHASDNHASILSLLATNQSVIPTNLPELLSSAELEQYLAVMSSLAIQNESSLLPRLTINSSVISVTFSESSSSLIPVNNQRNRFFPSPTRATPTQLDPGAGAHERSFNEVIGDYNYILEQEPNNIAALLGRAELCGGYEYTQAALDDYRRVLELEPENAKAREGIEQLVGSMSWAYAD